VTAYVASGCHLCEAALEVLEAARREIDFELTVVDITGDQALERAYRERLPVVEIGGREAFTYFVHPAGLREQLAGAPD
jgi:glutaredoxin